MLSHRLLRFIAAILMTTAAASSPVSTTAQDAPATAAAPAPAPAPEPTTAADSKAAAKAPDGPKPGSVIRLWDGPAPGLIDNPGEEKPGVGGRVSNVSVPSLDVYLPAKEKSNGIAIIVCSGGGYAQIASGPRGSGAAAVFVPMGYTVLSLKYRLRPPSTDVHRDALEDGKRAVRLVRSRAAEWGLKHIGIMGFSAGANLVLNLSTHFDAGNPAATDPLEKLSCRPDFSVMACPWAGGKKIENYPVAKDAPPALILHARDDKTAPFAFAEQIESAWKAAGAPVLLIPYEKGGHEAFSFPHMSARDWPGKFMDWLKTTPSGL